LLSRAGIGPNALANQIRQQVNRILQGQRIQLKTMRAFPRNQAGQRISARHHRPAGRGSRKQRPDLLGGSPVVQHYQNPASCHQGPKPLSALFLAGRDIPARDAE
jgi:hypothetical protein